MFTDFGLQHTGCRKMRSMHVSGCPGWRWVRKLSPSFPWKVMIYIKCHYWKLLEISTIIWLLCGDRTRRVEVYRWLLPTLFSLHSWQPLLPSAPHILLQPSAQRLPDSLGAAPWERLGHLQAGSMTMIQVAPVLWRCVAPAVPLFWTVLKDAANRKVIFKNSSTTPHTQLNLFGLVYSISPIPKIFWRLRVGQNLSSPIPALHRKW